VDARRTLSIDQIPLTRSCVQMQKDSDGSMPAMVMSSLGR
jgi:hypothetical protein